MIPSSEHDALRNAVLANPDDDLPRLVFADWLDENGDLDGARFIRSQIALATLPEWDPQAVALRRTQLEWDLSEAWQRELPKLSSDRGLYWVAQNLFRRGFAHFIQVPMLRSLQQELPELLKAAPIQRLGLYAATLEQWKEFVASPWMPRIREIDFEGIGAPVEAMREICAARGLTGIRALRFRSSTSAAMPEVLDRLLRSELGDRLETLELAHAFGSDASYFEDFFEAFHVGGAQLKSLRLQSMGFGGIYLHRFLTSRAWSRLEELVLEDENSQPAGPTYLRYPECWPELRTVRLHGVSVNYDGLLHLANALRPPNLTVLELANSALAPEAVQGLAKAEHLAKLRIIRLRRMRVDNRGVRYLTQARFWKNLVELDLRGNPIDANGAKHLLKRQPPPELELLRLDQNFPDNLGDALQKHFNGRVIFEQSIEQGA